MTIEGAKQEIKDVSAKIDCKRESGEKQKIVNLGKNLEGLNAPKQKADLITCRDLLGIQKLGAEQKTVQQFLETDIKTVLQSIKSKLDADAAASNTPTKVGDFVREMEAKLPVLCGNRSDKVALLQVYLNSINDVNEKHATIPYKAANYGYEAGDTKRLFVDGILGPHTYNALRLATFGEGFPMTTLKRKQTYEFKDDEPRIINRDLPYIPLTLPGLDKTGNVNTDKSIEIIDEPKIKGSIELLYLFYDGVGKKDKLSVDIDNEIMKIMTNPNAYDPKFTSEKPIDVYLNAIKQLNRKIAGENSDLKKGRDLITKFINGALTPSAAELGLLTTLENDIGVHDYVAEYIASKYIDLSKEPYKSKMDKIKTNPKDKGYTEMQQEVNKKWIEQEKIQRAYILDTFNTAKREATTPEKQQELCAMFGVATVAEVTPGLISDKTDDAIDIAQKEFKTQMLERYLTKRLLEEKVRGDLKNLSSMTGQYEGKDKLIALFGDIQGIGYLNPSSENMDITKDIALMVAEEAACFAIGAITAGVGGVALKMALYGRRAMRILRVSARIAKGTKGVVRLSKFDQIRVGLKALNRAEKIVRAERTATRGGKAINTTTTILGVTVGGAAFYEGANTMQNIMKGVPMFDGWDNVPEITKTIAMFGALKLVSKLVNTKVLKSIAGKQYNVNPFNQLATKNTDKIFTRIGKIAGESVVGGTAIFAVEHTGDMLIEEDPQHPWTKEEFIQAVLMYMIFRGAGEVGKLKLTKNPKTGKPEIQKPNPKVKEPVETKKEPVKKEFTPDQKSEYNRLKADKRAYIEQQQEINKKIKTLENTKTYKEDLTKDLQKAKEAATPIENDVSALERRVQTHKDQIKLLEDPKYKAANGMSEVEAKKAIELNKKDMSVLEKQLVDKQKLLEPSKQKVKALEDKIKAIEAKQKIIHDQISILESKIQNHKDQIKLLEDPRYKAANAINEARANELIELNKKDMSVLEKQVAGKQEELLAIEKDFAQKDIQNLRQDWLHIAPRVDDINTIIAREYTPNPTP